MRNKKKWRHVFLEIALRAIRKTHYDFGVWELGQENLTLDHFRKLNQGDGINFAPEETVRDSILQEITYTGLWKTHKINDDPTSYWIDREVDVYLNKKDAITQDKDEEFFAKEEYKQADKHSSDQKYFSIDIVFKRIQDQNPKFGDKTYPSLIEAKRFKLVTVDHRTSKLKIGDPQISGIDRDILKLKLIRDCHSGKQLEIKGEVYDNFFTYILLWGTSPSKFNLRNDVINLLTKKEYLLIDDPDDPEAPIVKYLPIEWEFKDEIIVTKLLWVTLIELK